MNGLESPDKYHKSRLSLVDPLNLTLYFLSVSIKYTPIAIQNWLFTHTTFTFNSMIFTPATLLFFIKINTQYFKSKLRINILNEAFSYFVRVIEHILLKRRIFSRKFFHENHFD